MIYVEMLIFNQKVYEKSINIVNIPETLWNVKAIKCYNFKSLNSFLNQCLYFTGIRESAQFFLGKDKGIVYGYFKNTPCRFFQFDLGAKYPL